jgi:hypothetical protein
MPYSSCLGYSYPLPEKIFFQSLRKDQHAIRTDVKRAAAGEDVALARFGDHVATPMAFEVVAVTLPVAVETKLPS